jgi:hypothetical protein
MVLKQFLVDLSDIKKTINIFKNAARFQLNKPNFWYNESRVFYP